MRRVIGCIEGSVGSWGFGTKECERVCGHIGEKSFAVCSGFRI